MNTSVDTAVFAVRARMPTIAAFFSVSLVGLFGASTSARARTRAHALAHARVHTRTRTHAYTHTHAHAHTRPRLTQVPAACSGLGLQTIFLWQWTQEGGVKDAR
eukprot:54710-Pleurochrysis_carterae.AAC.1